MINAILVCIYLLLTVSGLVLFKLGATNGLAFNLMNGTFLVKFNSLVVIGLFCYLCSFALYMYLVSKFNLSYIFPLTNGIVYVLIFLASIFVFRERMSMVNVIGIALVLSGVVLINIKK